MNLTTPAPCLNFPTYSHITVNQRVDEKKGHEMRETHIIFLKSFIVCNRNDEDDRNDCEKLNILTGVDIELELGLDVMLFLNLSFSFERNLVLKQIKFEID